MMTRPKFKVAIAVGGSGGHLFPAQKLAERLQGDAEVAFAGHKLEESPFFARKFPFVEIAAAPLKRGFFSASWRGFWQAIRFLRRYSPDVVVGFGSYHSFPILCAAALLRKKIFLFEANCSVGKVNRLFLPFAKKIAGQLPLPVAPKKQVLVPLLPWEERKRISRAEARRYFQLCPETFTLLIFGGSQGASFFNEVMPAVCARLKDIQVIHLSGRGEVVHSVPASVKPFEQEMEKAYEAADLAIVRGGAGTIAELIQFALPALCIPYPYASEEHQRKNGEFFAHQIQGGRLLLQTQATVEKIVEEVETLRQQREVYQKALAAYSLQCQGRRGLEEIVRGEKR